MNCLLGETSVDMQVDVWDLVLLQKHYKSIKPQKHLYVDLYHYCCPIIVTLFTIKNLLRHIQIFS